MKRVLTSIVVFIMVIGAMLFFCYPLISNYINSRHTDSAVMQYLNTALQLDGDEYEEKIKLANEYNASLVGNVIVGDPFATKGEDTEKYSKLLELDETTVIATVEIPSLQVNLPVYYGTGEEVLEKGIGHLNYSSLPVGGKSTHSVLTGHTGLGGLKIFSDLDQLETGDVFFINCMGERLTYKVDNIAVVLPDETDLLQIEADKDYVTLVTCTPYGVNTHRLLVRGTRIPTEEASEIIQQQPEKKSESTWVNQYRQALLSGVVVMAVILTAFGIYRLIIFLLRKRKKNEEQDN